MEPHRKQTQSVLALAVSHCAGVPWALTLPLVVILGINAIASHPVWWVSAFPSLNLAWNLPLPRAQPFPVAAAVLLIVLQPLAQTKVRDIKSGYKTKFNYIRELEGQRDKS